MERPLGVTILAILHFIGVFFAICAGLLMILGMGFFAAALARAANIGSGGAGIIAGLGVVLAIFAFIGAAISGLIGWGLWNLKNWARITAMVFAVLGMLGGVGSAARENGEKNTLTTRAMKMIGRIANPLFHAISFSEWFAA